MTGGRDIIGRDRRSDFCYSIYGPVAQMGERRACNAEVASSILRQVHQFAGVAQWESATLPKLRSPDRSRFPAPILPACSSVAELRAHNALVSGSIPLTPTIPLTAAMR